MKILLLILCAYGIGNILTGYVIAKLYRKNIHHEGSGNVGARNAGRLFGKKAFVITFLGDALKGAAVILLFRWAGLDEVWQLFGLFAVIFGHIYPIVFHFKGGKGISTLIGGFLVFNPMMFAIFIGCFLLFFLIKRSLTLAGMAAFLMIPILLVIYSYSTSVILIGSVIIVLIIFAHRKNIKEKIAQERK